MTLHCLFCFLALLVLSASEVIKLEPFSEVIVCIPLAVQVRPRTNDDISDYSITVNAQDAVADALKFRVSDGVLELTAYGDVTVTERVEITVALPKDALRVVESTNHNNLFVDAGFELNELTIISESGITFVDDIVVDTLIIKATKQSIVLAKGTIQKAKISVHDGSSVIVNGVLESVKVKVKGASKVMVLGDETKRITGKLSGSGEVVVDAPALCEVEGSSGCTYSEDYMMPDLALSWSEQQKFSGQETCSIRPSDRGRASTTSYVNFGDDEDFGFLSVAESVSADSTVSARSSSLGSRGSMRRGPPFAT